MFHYALVTAGTGTQLFLTKADALRAAAFALQFGPCHLWQGNFKRDKACAYVHGFGREYSLDKEIYSTHGRFEKC